MSPQQPAVLHFGRIQIEPALRQLRVDGRIAAIGARAFDLLLSLVERRERIVSKGELLDLVWPGLVVEENNLQVQISTLRKQLGARAIATIPGRGYQFCVPLDTVPAGHAEAATTPAASSTPKPKPIPGPVDLSLQSNLPVTLAPLFGREIDLTSLNELMASHRLVTLAGAAGIGKTRLAQAAAHGAIGSYVDGVWFIEMAPVRQPDQVPGALARVLSVALESGSEVPALCHRLAQRLADRHMLVVLDNCEHLVDAVAQLACALLHGASRVQLLVTSQLPLKLHEEQLVRLNTLAVPMWAHDAVRPPGTDEGALSLFEAAVQALLPRFSLAPGQRAAAIEICRRLDGIALAIELAAARVPLLGVEGLRQRLDDRFQLLTTGARLAPPRHQTLRAALEWSHGLLDADEQKVFRRLGIFVGGFGLASAQFVAMDETLDAWAVLDRMSGLVDKSLVMIEPGDPPRYRLLESWRAFALERLVEAHETSRLAEQHARAVLAQMTQAHEQRWTVRGDHLLPTLLPDIDNLRAALHWAAEGEEPHRATLLMALAGASAWVWKAASLDPEGLHWCRLAWLHLDADTPPEIEASLLQGFAETSHQIEADRELASLQRAALLWKACGQPRNAYLALSLLAQKLSWRYDLPAAEQALQEAMALHDAHWPPLLQEPLLVAKTYLMEASGHPERGQAWMEELVALMRRWGDPQRLAAAQLQLAENLFVQGKAAEAVQVRREVAAAIGALRSIDAGWNLSNLSAALVYLGRVDEAADAARASLPLLRLGDRCGAHMDHLALLACHRGRYPEAARALGRTNVIYQQSGFRRELSEQRAYDMALSKLRENLPAAQLSDCMAQGSRRTDDERMALELLDSEPSTANEKAAVTALER